MRITIPYPPTANLYWRHAQGRTFLSAAAKAFKTEVRKRLAAAKVTPQEGPLALHVHVYRPRKVGDLDNTLKVLGDALNGAAWHDDKQVVEIHAYRHDDKENPRAEVEVTSTQPVTLIERLTATRVIGERIADAVLAHPLPRKGDAAKAREEVTIRTPLGPRTRKPNPHYTPPRSTPVDAAKACFGDIYEALLSRKDPYCTCSFRLNGLDDGQHQDACDISAWRRECEREARRQYGAAKEAEATFAPDDDARCIIRGCGNYAEPAADRCSFHRKD